MAKFYHQIACTTLMLFTGILFAQKNSNRSIAELYKQSPSLKGKTAFLGTPFNTAGDRLYMIGHQDGSFPDLGWHIKDEMGGIWHHPIKLMDGFETIVTIGNKKIPLTKADAFENFPFGNKHYYSSQVPQLLIERYQFVPDQLPGIYIEYAMTNTSHLPQRVTITINGTSNLMPVWLGERTGMINSKDIAFYEPSQQRWLVKDSLNPWYVLYGSPLTGKPSDQIQSKSNKPLTSVTSTSYDITILPKQIYYLPMIIAGSAKSKSEALEVYDVIQNSAVSLLQQKQQRLKQVSQQSKLTLNDQAITNSFEWLKYNSDWLTMQVDSIGRGVVAGLPDYPWWFGGDMAYTLKGLIAMGRKDLVYSTVDLVHRISEKHNGNGRIVHEVSTNGAVFNPGNVNETPQFVSLIWDVFCWTGDQAFLQKYFPSVVKGLNWVLTENDANHNLLPDGAGMMEIHGLNSEMIDVAAYTQKAFADAAKMAKYLKQDALAADYLEKAANIKAKINQLFWVESDQSYADFIATKAQALQLIADAIVRADTLGNQWAVKALSLSQQQTMADTSTASRGFVMHHNWVVNTPLETGIADKAKAIKALETAKKFTNAFGMYVTGIDKNVKRDEKEYSYAASVGKNDFTYTGTVMTLPTAVQIIAENNYGRPNEAFQLLKRVDKTFGYALPGSMYEVSPDYGMMTQAWNVYAYGEPIVKQFFGIQPLAFNQQMVISPQMPTALSKGSLENVQIGNNMLSIGFTNIKDKLSFQLTQTKEDWTIVFQQPIGKFKKWKLNGQVVIPEKTGETEQIIIRSKNATIVLTR